MSTLATYWEMMQLAQAAYVDLDSNLNNSIIARLRSPLSPNESYAFSDTQASLLIGVSGFRVVDMSANANDPYGFSATLFQDNRTGAYTLAIRGTENTTTADIAYSIREIGTWGIAAHQTVSLYNYFQRLITLPGEPVKQLVLEELNEQPAASDSRPYVEILSPTSEQGVVYLALDSYYANDGIGILANESAAQLTVVGHSLGGHLGMALSRLFPNWVDSVVTSNAPGFIPTNADPFLQMIDPSIGPFDPMKIENVYSYNGADIIAGMHTLYGQRVGVLIEDQTPTLTGNHSITLQARSLALHALFEKIDPDFDVGNSRGQVAFPKIDALIRAGAPDHPSTYESTLGSLSKLFLNEDHDIHELEDLETYYATLYRTRAINKSLLTCDYF